MLKVRNNFFNKYATRDSKLILQIAREMYNSYPYYYKKKEKLINYKNYSIYYKNIINLTPEIIVEKTIPKYDKYDNLTRPCDIFINLPKITELNLPVKIINSVDYNKKIKLINALEKNIPYVIEPYSVYGNNNNIDNQDTILSCPISLEISEEFKEKLIFKEIGQEILLSTVTVDTNEDMNEHIIKLIVDPLLLKNKTKLPKII